MTSCWQHNSQFCSFSHLAAGIRGNILSSPQMLIFIGSIIILEQQNAHGSCCTFLTFLLTNQCWCYSFALLLTCYILPKYPLQIQSVGFRVSEPPPNCFPTSFKEASNKGRENHRQGNGCKIRFFQSVHTHLPVFAWVRYVSQACII